MDEAHAIKSGLHDDKTPSLVALHADFPPVASKQADNYGIKKVVKRKY